MEEHRKAPGDPAVSEDPGCTAEGSPGEPDRSLEARRTAVADRTAEAGHTAEVADHTAAAEAGHNVAAEKRRRGRRCSSHQRDYDLQERHRQGLRGNHHERAANLWSRSLSTGQKRFQNFHTCGCSPVGLSLGLSSSSSNSFIFFLRKSMLGMCC